MQPDAPSAVPGEDTEEPLGTEDTEDTKEHTEAGPMTLLPEGVLDQVMSPLAGARGSCIRSTCSWLRGSFDRCNTRLVLRGTAEQLPHSFPARLLDLVRCSPRVSSLTLAEDMDCVSWPQVLEAGGPQLLERLERLELKHCPHTLDLEALAACTRLQHLALRGPQPGQATEETLLQLQALAACGGTLRRLVLYCCSSLHDISFLAACAALERLTLTPCQQLEDLGPLAACVQLRELWLVHSRHLQDLSPLSACTQLHSLLITEAAQLTDLGPLAACAALQELSLGGCRYLSDLSPLAACVALQRVDLTHCKRVQALRPLASCKKLLSLHLKGCQAMDRATLAALPRLIIYDDHV